MLMPDSVRDSLSDLVPQFMNYINAGQLIPSVKEIRMRMALHRFLDRESWCRIQKITYYCLPIWTVSIQLFICFTAPYARFLCHKDKTNAMQAARISRIYGNAIKRREFPSSSLMSGQSSNLLQTSPKTKRRHGLWNKLGGCI